MQHFDSFLQKHYTRPLHEKVHDPSNILHEGDVITYGLFPPSERAKREAIGKLGGTERKRGVRFTLREVVTPFGTPVDQRTAGQNQIRNNASKDETSPGTEKLSKKAQRKLARASQKTTSMKPGADKPGALASVAEEQERGLREAIKIDREMRFKSGLCLVCGAEGHTKKECPENANKW